MNTHTRTLQNAGHHHPGSRFTARPRPPRRIPDALVEEAAATPIGEVADRISLSLKRAGGGELVGPCPSCGGDDRFAINPRKNVFNCRGCDEGGGTIKLVQKALGVDFVAAVEFVLGREVASVIIDPAELDRRKQEAKAKQARRDADAARYRAKAREDAERLWKMARAALGTLAEHYLRFRGIPDNVIAEVLAAGPIRYLERCEYRKNGKVHFEGPAMIACLQKPTGGFAGIHRTWIDLDQPKGRPIVLDADGKPLKTKLTLGSKQGSAIRLIGQRTDDLPGTMIVGEGIETTLSVVAHARRVWGVGGRSEESLPNQGVAAWCLSDLGNMAGRALSREHRDWPDMDDIECWRCPPQVRRLIYLGDDGPDHTPTRVKLERGLRRHQRLASLGDRALETRMAWAGDGLDFNDLLL